MCHPAELPGGSAGCCPALLEEHQRSFELLLRLFPDAQFVYIHRHPAAVYQSACHMADTQYWHMYLATPTSEQIHEFILNQFEVLWREYAAARALVPPGNLVEISYAELTAEPVRVGVGVGVGVAQP